MINAGIIIDSTQKRKVILYYSLCDKTKEIAETKAREMNVDSLVKIEEIKKRSKFGALIPGIFEAKQQKKSPIHPLNVDLNQYGTIIIFMPLWGGNPAPAMNSVIELIPKGKMVELYMISAKGCSIRSADNTCDKIQERGSLVIKYVDIKIK